MKQILLSVSLLAYSLSLQAQESLVMDINPGTQSSYPTRLTAFKDRLMFFADDGVNGNEIWSLTDTSVSMLFNINPGTPGSGLIINYTKMAVAGGKLFFPADDGTTGQELYSWDGDMNNPPALVADINTSPVISTIGEVISYNDKVYFTAYRGTYGYELWMHDPMSGNTNVVTAIAGGSSSSTPQNLTPYKGKIYFSATSGTTGRELYMYDPMTNNATIAADINPNSLSSDPQSLVVADDILYFSASTYMYGRELYAYNGTTVTRLSDLANSTSDGMLYCAPGQNRIGSLKGKIYFCGDDGTTGAQLYQHNKNNGTQTLTYNINPSATSFPSSFITYGDYLYFAAYDDIHGVELWRYNGDSIPEMVADIDIVGSGNPMNMEIFNNVLYFSANTQDEGTELFRYVDSMVVTGVQNVRFDGNVNIYPNPTNADVNIQLSLTKAEDLNITMVDAAGKLVYSTGAKHYTTGSTTVNIPMANCATGVYFYRITGANNRMYFSGRLLKQ